MSRIKSNYSKPVAGGVIRPMPERKPSDLYGGGAAMNDGHSKYSCEKPEPRVALLGSKGKRS
jgi:hypothetical protein